MIAIASIVLLLPALIAAQCSQVHVFGARETTVSPGYGSSGTVVTSITSAYSNSSSEAITYPACGGQASCGSISYASSATQGTANAASQVNTYNANCPNTVLVLVGYSQGGQIFDNAYCGGGDTGEGISNTAIPISAAAQKKIAAAIFMGDPRFVAGFSYEVGTCTAYGFDARPSSFSCPYASNIQSYCDSQDPYCCTGTDAAHHQLYGSIYGSVALTFVKNKVNAMLAGSTTTTTSSGGTNTTTTTTTSSTGGACGAKYAQCGGLQWTGSTCCASGSTCTYGNAYYSQCL